MWPKILIAAVAGGLLAFCMGAFNHMILGLQGRAIEAIPDETSFIDQIKARSIRTGLYMFPGVLEDSDQQDHSQAFAEFNERYKAGPNGLLLIGPTGEDVMGPKQLGLELAANVVAALLAAWIVSLIAADVGFVQRWGAVLIMGVFTWFSVAASYGIWYRFPQRFVLDELLGAALEWGVAGLAIAAIVRRPSLTASPPQP
jgi:hypothetical protein